MKFKSIFAGAAVAASLTTAALALPAHASTHSCDVALNGCRSIQSEVPNRPDLDVQGGASNVGNVLIVFTRSATDKAEDFVVRTHPVTDTSIATVAGTPGVTAGQTLSARFGPTSVDVSLEFAPNGVPSHLCASSVNPNGFASVQLRPCDNVSGTFNPWQTFNVTDYGAADGQFVTYTEPINSLVMTNPANNGSIGTVGHRVQVRFAHAGSPNLFTGQLWGKNNS